jgi:hypothetical protein
MTNFQSRVTKEETPNNSMYLLLVLGLQRLHIPNLLSILTNAAIAREESHSGDRSDCLAGPLILVFKGFVHEGVSGNVGMEIIADEVIVAMINDGADESTKGASVSKHATLKGVEDSFQIRIDGVLPVIVGMA